LPRKPASAAAREGASPGKAAAGKPAGKKPGVAVAKQATSGGDAPEPAAPVRAFWSGTITFGLVSIPVDLFAAVRPRRKSMKMVDGDGHPLGRQFYCPEDGAKLSADDMVRGYETEDGEMVVVTDEELEAIAPEATRDIDLRRFVPLEQIPPMYFQRPYFLAPAGRSTKAYHLLSATMERTGRVGIGTFVMRSHEYLVAILSEGGVLRAETLRFADEIRSPEDLELAPPGKAPAKRKDAFAKEIAALTREELDVDELRDRQAQALREVAHAKEARGEDLVDLPRAEDEEESEGAEIVDLMQILRRSLSKKAVVTTAESDVRPESNVRPAPPSDIASARRRAAGIGGAKARGAKSGKAASDRDALQDLSREELYKRAQELDIAGRSKMDRASLLKALRAAA
jgi:DNA end-binding protein Ku